MFRFESYSGSLRQLARAVARPADLDELRDQVRGHDPDRDGGLTVRATGNSLHHQALGTGVVLLLEELPHSIRVTVGDEVQRLDGEQPVTWTTAEVSGWTPWEAVVRATLRLGAPDAWARGEAVWRVDGYSEEPPAAANRCFWQPGPGVDPGAPLPRLVPYTMVSSGRITPAGSLSSDAVWRFAAALGREADSVVWLDLLTGDGTVLRLFNSRWGLWDCRDLHPGAQATGTRADNDAAFDAVVGGFGLLGVIVAIKYLLLELDPRIAADEFALSPPLDGETAIADATEDDRESRRGEARLARAAGAERTERAGSWPSYPHAGEAELGRTGEEIEPRALTWMWPTASADVLVRTLAAHRSRHADEDGAIGLPPRVTKETVACFAVVFANSRDPMRSAIGNVAYGRAPAGASRFKLWDRRYGWKNTDRILDLHLLPWAAKIGEWFVYRSVFADAMEKSPTADPIPEFAFFMEGHTVAIADERDKPRTLQQAWSIPVEIDEHGNCVAGAELVADFLAAVRTMSRRCLWLRNAVRVQVCDVKCVPPGRALLSSSRGVTSMMVTVTVENVRGYRWLFGGWGSPERAFRGLTRAFARRGVKLHLGKNLHARASDVRMMYGDAFRSFLAVKQRLDPRGVWSSDLLALIEK